jgi:hypothetical protein
MISSILGAATASATSSAKKFGGIVLSALATLVVILVLLAEVLGVVLIALAIGYGLYAAYSRTRVTIFSRGSDSGGEAVADGGQERADDED